MSETMKYFGLHLNDLWFRCPFQSSDPPTRESSCRSLPFIIQGDSKRTFATYMGYYRNSKTNKQQKIFSILHFIKITPNFDILTKDTYKFIININHWRANHYQFIISINARCDCYIIYIVIIYISYEQDLNIIMILIRLSKSYSVKQFTKI